jgi:hypothetical protein
VIHIRPTKARQYCDHRRVEFTANTYSVDASCHRPVEHVIVWRGPAIGTLVIPACAHHAAWASTDPEGLAKHLGYSGREVLLVIAGKWASS